MKLLQTLFYIGVIAALAIVVLFETGIQAKGGDVSTVAQYYAQMTMIIATIVGVPLALKMFKLKAVEAKLKATPEAALKMFGSIRLLLLLVPMVCNIYLYYLTANTSFFYLAIVGMLALFFVFPSKSRCEEEMSC